LLRAHSKKFTDKQTKRNFKLDKALGVFASRKSKQYLGTAGGLASTAIMSTKKQSKISEEIEGLLSRDSTNKKLIPPSPVVKLDKRVPKKNISKNSSKKSSKKSGKKKRVPRKYVKPNMSKEKVSNKSVANILETGARDSLLVALKNEEAKVEARGSHTTSHQQEAKGKKGAPRFTISGVKLDVICKQGVIKEEGHESSGFSDDSDSDRSVSHEADEEDLDSSESDSVIPLPMLETKAKSQAINMQTKQFKADSEILNQALGRMMKKPEKIQFFPQSTTNLGVPGHDVE
jgi:hypothetical protein